MTKIKDILGIVISSLSIVTSILSIQDQFNSRSLGGNVNWEALLVVSGIVFIVFLVRILVRYINSVRHKGR